MHAYRFGNLPGLKMHYVREADHDYVVLMLHQSGLIDGLLLECLFDHPPALHDAVRLDRFTPRLPLPSTCKDLSMRTESSKDACSPFPTSAISRLDAATVSAAGMADTSFLLDELTPGVPMVLWFSDAPQDQAGGFEFFEVSEHLAERLGCRLNRVLMRDLQSQWWLRGVPGMGEDSRAVSLSLRGMIDSVCPERVICVGNGMGGYAAILFAMLLQADHAIALNPLSLLDNAFAHLTHDRRHEKLLAALDCASLPHAPRDLLQLASETRYTGRLDVLYGVAQPVDAWHVGSHNAVHAARLGLLPNTRLHPWSEVMDAKLLQWLEIRKVLPSFIYRAAFADDVC